MSDDGAPQTTSPTGETAGPAGETGGPAGAAEPTVPGSPTAGVSVAGPPTDGPPAPQTTGTDDGGPASAADAPAPAPAPSIDGPVPADAQWRRLDRRMLLVHPVTELIRFLPALVILFLFGRSNDSGGEWWHLGAVVVIVGIGLLRYVTTSYRITPEQIQLRKGLVSRHVLSARLDRVRTVDLTARPIHRLLGLSKVVIGTGSSSSKRDEELALDALRVDVARGLRAELLHQRAVAVPEHGPAVAAPAGNGGGSGDTVATRRPGAPATAGSEVGAGVGAGAAAAQGTAYEPADLDSSDRVLVRLDPTWVRFAPLTTSGIVVGAAALGFLANLLNQASGNAYGAAWDYVRSWSFGWTVTILLALVTILVGVSILAITGYLLANWGLVVSHNPAGHSYHLRRGLLTTRETSIDESRVRGLQVGSPLGLRLAGGGRLEVIVTGLTKKSQSAATLVPPAPAEVVERVGEDVLGESGPLTVPLAPHGPAARRRRFVRALIPAVLLLLVLLGLVLAFDWPRWLPVLGLVPVIVAVPLAADRYAALGSALTGRYLVVRSGSFNRRRDALERDGIIGWNVRQSIFQRRQGVATLTATTAAGQQAYTAYDLPVGRAVALADEATPGMLSEFLT